MTAKQPQTPNGYHLRPASCDDLDAVVQLMNQASIHDSGMVTTSLEDKRIEWGLPQFNLDTDTLLVQSSSDQAVGYVEVWDSEPHVHHHLFGYVHPDVRGQGIGTYLMAWAEDQARSRLSRAPQGAKVSLQTACPRQNRSARALFEQRDYECVRSFQRMRIDMAPDSPPPAPVWPEGIRVRPYILDQDDRAVHRTVNQAFKDHWGFVEGESFEEWFHWIEQDADFDPSVCFVALTNGQNNEEMVGTIMARPKWERDENLAWVDELAVLRPWRRQGIGTALLHQVFDAFYRQGRYSVGLTVDIGSLTNATRIYEQAGMHVFWQVDVFERVLRPGADLSAHALDSEAS